MNGLNQYTSAGPATFGYDANGNLTGDGTHGYGYDIENRLVSVTNGLQLSYDPLGRLYQTSGAASGTTQFLYDGDALVAEYDGAGAMRHRYVHSDGADDPLVWYEGAGLGSPRYLYADHQGSVVGVADASGNLISANTYDEYGITRNTATGALAPYGRFGFTGQAWLPDLGMYHYKARVYSPTLGRFLQTDPIGYEDQVNLYAYVANDPVNASDTTGLCTGSLISERGGGGACVGHGGVNPTLAGAGLVDGGLPNDTRHSQASLGTGVGTGIAGALSGVSPQSSGILGDLYEEYDNALTIAQLGRLGEEAAAAAIVARGYIITGVQVRVQTPLGLRIIDYIATGRDGPHAFEVKVNNSYYSNMQSRKDNLIYGGNGVSAGHLNPSFPYGSRIPAMPTTVERVQCRMVPVIC